MSEPPAHLSASSHPLPLSPVGGTMMAVLFRNPPPLPRPRVACCNLVGDLTILQTVSGTVRRMSTGDADAQCVAHRAHCAHHAAHWASASPVTRSHFPSAPQMHSAFRIPRRTRISSGRTILQVNFLSSFSPTMGACAVEEEIPSPQGTTCLEATWMTLMELAAIQPASNFPQGSNKEVVWVEEGGVPPFPLSRPRWGGEGPETCTLCAEVWCVRITFLTILVGGLLWVGGYDFSPREFLIPKVLKVRGRKCSLCDERFGWAGC